jgi:ethanolamine ammonia-lyase small subunit
MANEFSHPIAAVMTSPPAKPGDDALWADLRKLTAARIGLKRSGASLATGALLEFQLAHARARDAVHAPLDEPKLAADLAPFGLPVLSITSAVVDKQTYLMRPDLGRQLGVGAAGILSPHADAYDVVFVVSDGLSAQAVQSHAARLLADALPVLRTQGWRIAPLVIVRHGRVAIGDAVAVSLGATCAVVLIGERPGLSAPDSMGAYVTWRPGAHTTDADRNCLSNIRPGGIATADAAFKLTHLMAAMRARRQSGVTLKDLSDRLLLGDM